MTPFDAEPLLNPATPEHPRQRLCTTYTRQHEASMHAMHQNCFGTPGFGYMWQAIGSTTWELAFRTKEYFNTGGYMAPSAAIVLVAILAAGDVAIAILCRLLLRLLRVNNERRKQLGAAVADKEEAQKTRVLLSLCILILVQMATITAAVVCGEVSSTLGLLIAVWVV